jgi:hypothetical protein
MRLPTIAALLLAAAGPLFSSSAHAATFGSRTKVTVSAVYTLPNPPTVIQFPSGAYREVDTVNTVRYGNKEILETLVKRQLIPSIKGYSIVMLRTARGTHSYTFVAAHATGVNVRIPEDLLDLVFDDGPEKGRYATNPQGVVTELKHETRNLAALTLEGFDGQAILVRKSSFKNITRNGETHTIRLDSARASFDGSVAVASSTGVGVATLVLSDARIVDLEDFGGAAPEDEEEEAEPLASAGSLLLPGDSASLSSADFSLTLDEVTGIVVLGAIGSSGETPAQGATL